MSMFKKNTFIDEEVVDGIQVEEESEKKISKRTITLIAGSIMAVTLITTAIIAAVRNGSSDNLLTDSIPDGVDVLTF